MLKSLWNRIKNLNKLFIWIVLVPMGLSILYFGLIASPIYISEARFVVYSPQPAGQQQRAGLFAQ